MIVSTGPREQLEVAVVEVVGEIVVEVVGPAVVPVWAVVAVTGEEVLVLLPSPGEVVPEPFELPQAASGAMAKRTKARAAERYRTCTPDDTGSD
jgi:hypothetical protein